MKGKWYYFTDKLHSIGENIFDSISCLFIHLKFIYQTKIYPLFVKHHWCTFYDWMTETEKKGWYVLNKHGKMIPWVHFDKGWLICLYPNMVTPIEK